jgi:hypothetical protein
VYAVVAPHDKSEGASMPATMTKTAALMKVQREITKAQRYLGQCEQAAKALRDQLRLLCELEKTLDQAPDGSVMELLD